MGGKKDINRVRELIFGKDIERFEKRFDALEAQQSSFEKDVSKQLKQLSKMFEHFIEEHSKELHYQNNKTAIALKELDAHIDAEAKRSSEHLKTLKTELKMYIKAKINNLDTKKISHSELSELFASVSDGLKSVDSIQKKVR